MTKNFAWRFRDRSTANRRGRLTSEYAEACPGPNELLDGTDVIRGSQVDGWAAPCRCVASRTPRLLPDTIRQ